MNESNLVALTRQFSANKFICPITNEEAYEWLKDDNNLAQMQQRLAPVGVQVVNINDEVFVGVNIRPTDDDKKKVIKEFDNIKNNLQPLIEILTTLATADEDGDGLYMGKRLHCAEMAVTANKNAEFASRLKKIAEYTNSQNKPNDEKIESILQKLRKEGLLHLVNQSKKIYQVTGKISYIHRVIAFISDYYVPREQQDTEEQQELL